MDILKNAGIATLRKQFPRKAQKKSGKESIDF